MLSSSDSFNNASGAPEASSSTAGARSDAQQADNGFDIDAAFSHTSHAEDPTHNHWMSLALAQAREALEASEVPVGCVFIRENSVIAAARNRTNQLRDATRHAELEAIDELLSSSSPSLPRPYPLQDVTLYVTVEPCIMCASALRQLGIKRVVYGCANARFGGCGSVMGVNAEMLHPVHPPYEAIPGYGREEAIMLLRRFYITENTNAPAPRSKARRILKTDIPSLVSPSLQAPKG